MAHGIEKGSKAWELTKDCAEVAIQGNVPREAIIGIIDALQLGIPQREGTKQSIADFKESASNNARWKLRDEVTKACNNRHDAANAPSITTEAAAPTLAFDAASFNTAHCQRGDIEQRCTKRLGTGCSCRKCDPHAPLTSISCGGAPCRVAEALLASLPTEWLKSLSNRPTRLQLGEWVEVKRNGSTLCVGKVTKEQLFATGAYELQKYELSACNILTATNATHKHDPHSTDVTRRCHCYESKSATQYIGPIDSDRGDSTRYTIAGDTHSAHRTRRNSATQRHKRFTRC